MERKAMQSAGLQGVVILMQVKSTGTFTAYLLQMYWPVFPGYPALTQKSDLEGKLGRKGNTFGHKDAAAQQGNCICARDYTLGWASALPQNENWMWFMLW